MLLRHVYLYLATDEFPQGMGSEFLFRCCYLNNYLTSRMRELRLVREYRGIFFQGSGVVGVPRIGFERGLLVPVAFSPTRYAALHPGEEHEFLITEGMERCAPEHSIPIDAMQAALEDFRRGGYRNEWTHQRKLLRPGGFHASLLCSLDSERFRLVLKLERKGVTMFEQPILETMPDELIFTYRFKEVALERDAVVVRDKFGDVLSSMPIPAS